MNNQEAIIAGVVKWLDNNSDLVVRCIERGAEKGVIAIAEDVGSQLASKGGRWMTDNTAELITAVAGQMAIGALSEVPGLSKKRAAAAQEPIENGSGTNPSTGQSGNGD